MDKIEHSLIIPFYKSASFLESTLDQVFEWFDSLDVSYEIICVDDGSPDDTWDTLNKYKKSKNKKELILLKHEVNMGKGYAIRTGVKESKGNFVYFTDADLTYPIKSLKSIIDALKDGADIAIACRTHPESKYVVAPTFFPILFRRHLMGRIFNLIVRLIVIPGIKDTQAGMKGFLRDAIIPIIFKGRLNRFSFDVELLFLARKNKLVIKEVPVVYIYRKEPSTVKFFLDTIRMLRDMFLIRYWNFKGLYDK